MSAFNTIFIDPKINLLDLEQPCTEHLNEIFNFMRSNPSYFPGIYGKNGRILGPPNSNLIIFAGGRNFDGRKILNSRKSRDKKRGQSFRTLSFEAEIFNKIIKKTSYRYYASVCTGQDCDNNKTEYYIGESVPDENFSVDNRLNVGKFTYFDCNFENDPFFQKYDTVTNILNFVTFKLRLTLFYDIIVRSSQPFPETPQFGFDYSYHLEYAEPKIETQNKFFILGVGIIDAEPRPVARSRLVNFRNNLVENFKAWYFANSYKNPTQYNFNNIPDENDKSETKIFECSDDCNRKIKIKVIKTKLVSYTIQTFNSQDEPSYTFIRSIGLQDDANINDCDKKILEIPLMDS